MKTQSKKLSEQVLQGKGNENQKTEYTENTQGVLGFLKKQTALSPPRGPRWLLEKGYR